MEGSFFLYTKMFIKTLQDAISYVKIVLVLKVWSAEFPLGPEELNNYYNDNYSPFKVKVGLANLFHLLFMV